MRIVVIGETGQVARELARRGCGHDLLMLDRAAADLADPAGAAAALERSIAGAAAVINAAAWTAVDRAEAEEPAALTVNGAAPGALARVAARHGVPFLHLSTDYVFDGSGNRPWRPDDPTAPLSAYGRTKLAGETAVRAAGGRHVILRTSWVFSGHGANFVKTMLRKGAETARLTVVADQIGGPTPAGDIAATLLSIAAQMGRATAPGGTYHYAGAPDVSWAEFARAIFRTAGMDVEVIDIASCFYPTPARRPQNSRLDCDTLATDFGIARPDWRVGLAEVVTGMMSLGRRS